MPQVKHNHHPRSEGIILWLFFALLIWLPLSFGSNRGWALHLMEFWSLGLCGIWLWLLTRHKVQFSHTFSRSHGLFGSLLAFASVILFQVLPLPEYFIALLRPVNSNLENAHWLTRSVDPGTTLRHLRTTHLH